MSDSSIRVYKCANDFYHYFSRISKGFHRNEKYGLGKDVLDNILRMIELIVYANDAQNKVEYIDLALKRVVSIQIRIRILNDNGSINIINYERCSEYFLEVKNQLLKWRNWAKNGTGNV